jgi:hypothetical protein
MTEDAGRIDHREYHLGLTAINGQRKPAWWTLRAALAGEAVEADIRIDSSACLPLGEIRVQNSLSSR